MGYSTGDIFDSTIEKYVTHHLLKNSAMSQRESTPFPLRCHSRRNEFTELYSLRSCKLRYCRHSAPLIRYNAGILGIPAPIYIDSLGHWAVITLFLYLWFLVRTAPRSTVVGYLKRRLRIFSGYWVSLLFVYISFVDRFQLLPVMHLTPSLLKCGWICPSKL